MTFSTANELIHIFSDLSFHELATIRKKAGEVLKDKYARGRGKPAYGNLPRCFSQDQLRLFFSTVRNEDVKTAFKLLFFYALRVGELSDLTIVPGQDLVCVHNSKCGRSEYLPIYDAVSLYLAELDTAQGYSPHYLRKCFRAVCRDAGLDFVYGRGKPTKNHPDGRPLYQFTTHSLRHTAITLFGRFVKDPYVVCEYSRHDSTSKLGVSAVYRHVSMDELRESLSKCFANILS